MTSRHRYRWAALVLAALAVVSCERGEPNNAVRPDGDGDDGANDASVPTDSAGDARHEDADVPEGVGDRCVSPTDCNSYLRCMDETCEVPPAVSGEADESTPTVTFLEDGRRRARFYIELAVSPAEHQKGLMYRRQMADGWGMLFIYGEERPLSFWMKNTYLPLDMVFIDGQGRVVNIIEDAEPMTDTKRRSEEPARYVLEVEAGVADKAGIEVDQQIELDRVDSAHRPEQ